MSIRNALLEAVKTLGWANCFQVVEEIDDSDIRIKQAAPELRAMVADGILETRVGDGGRFEYALADSVRLRSAPATRIDAAPSPMVEAGQPVPAAAPAPPPGNELAAARSKIDLAAEAILAALAKCAEPATGAYVRAQSMQYGFHAVTNAIKRMKKDGRMRVVGNTSNARYYLASKSDSMADAIARHAQTPDPKIGIGPRDGELAILRYLVNSTETRTRAEIAASLDVDASLVNLRLTKLKKRGLANWTGQKFNAQWSSTLSGRKLIYPQSAVFIERCENMKDIAEAAREVLAENLQPETADPAPQPCSSIELMPPIEAIVESIGEIPAAPMARSTDEIPSDPGRSSPGFQLAFLDRSGLTLRAEAIAQDIEDLVEDACEAKLDHALIQQLNAANAAVLRALRHMAQA